MKVCLSHVNGSYFMALEEEWSEMYINGANMLFVYSIQKHVGAGSPREGHYQSENRT